MKKNILALLTGLFTIISAEAAITIDPFFDKMAVSLTHINQDHAQANVIIPMSLSQGKNRQIVPLSLVFALDLSELTSEKIKPLTPESIVEKSFLPMLEEKLGKSLSFDESNKVLAYIYSKVEPYIIDQLPSHVIKALHTESQDETIKQEHETFEEALLDALRLSYKLGGRLVEICWYTGKYVIKLVGEYGPSIWEKTKAIYQQACQMGKYIVSFNEEHVGESKKQDAVR